ncbi:MAG: transcription elongation factor GreB [Bdellovibrionales bacterium]|nr:transcription elongation factor GreB [Bdellovibrionales bacterium]
MEQKNYITPSGFRKLQEEFRRLKHEERPQVVDVVAWAASNGDRSENADYHYGKKRLREIDRRLRFLSSRMEAAEIIDPGTVRSNQVLFGATVRLLDEDDKERTYTILGADESDPDRGRISWLSPLARALHKAKAGDFVTFRSPQGERELEVLEVRYESVSD